jgi:hypothetical protein
MNIIVRIERLILDGVNIPPSQRHLLRASAETEIARLFADGEVSPNLSEGVIPPHFSASTIQLAVGNDSVQLGRQIAQAVSGGFEKCLRSPRKLSAR